MVTKITASKLIEILQKMPPDTLIVVPTQHGTLIQPMQIGLVLAIPAHVNKNMSPGNEWRVPTNSKDEPETDRKRYFIVG